MKELDEMTIDECLIELDKLSAKGWLKLDSMELKRAVQLTKKVEGYNPEATELLHKML